MSYEGYDEYICSRGHRFTDHCLSNHPDECPWCGASVEWWHPVDLTNGIDEENLASTAPAPTEEVNFEDDWREDHYGTRYAVKIPLVRPTLDAIKERSWRAMPGSRQVRRPKC